MSALQMPKVRKFRVLDWADKDMGLTEEKDPINGSLIDHKGDQYLVIQVDDQARLIRVCPIDGKRQKEIVDALMQVIVGQFTDGAHTIQDAVSALLHLAALISGKDNNDPEKRAECAEGFLEWAHAHSVVTFGLAATVHATAGIHQRSIESGLHISGSPPSA